MKISNVEENTYDEEFAYVILYREHVDFINEDESYRVYTNTRNERRLAKESNTFNNIEIYPNVFDAASRSLSWCGSFDRIFRIQINTHRYQHRFSSQHTSTSKVKIVEKVDIDINDKYVATEIVSRRPDNISYIRNPSIELQKLALSMGGHRGGGNIFSCISGDIDDEIVIYAIDCAYDSIDYINDPTDDLKILSIKSYAKKLGIDFDSIVK